MPHNRLVLQNGFIPIIFLILGLVIVGSSAVVYTFQKNSNLKVTQNTPKPTQAPPTDSTPSAQPSSVQPTSTSSSSLMISCKGPDGKSFQATQKDCDAFTKAWLKSQPTTTPTQDPKAALKEKLKNYPFASSPLTQEQIDQAKKAAGY